MTATKSWLPAKIVTVLEEIAAADPKAPPAKTSATFETWRQALHQIPALGMPTPMLRESRSALADLSNLPPDPPEARATPIPELRMVAAIAGAQDLLASTQKTEPPAP
jgi:hypothetical protein